MEPTTIGIDCNKKVVIQIRMGIEETLRECSSPQTPVLLAWIRTDIKSDPVVTYVVIFKRERCLSFRFAMSLDVAVGTVQRKKEKAFITTFLICPRASDEVIKLSILQEIELSQRGWQREEKCIERVRKLIDCERKAIRNYCMNDARPATVHEDYHDGIDMWITYHKKNGGTINVPIQIKSSHEGVENHKKIYPHIPVWLYDPSFSATRIKEELNNLCWQYAKKH